MTGRFIKLHDKILNWEWYRNTNVKVVFLHLLLKANYKDMSFEGRIIHRGQLVTSIPKLASELMLSARQIRVSLEHLKMTGEVSSTTCRRYRIITVIHYDEYQSGGSQNGSLMTGKTAGKRQADDSLMTASIEYIENIEKDRNIESPSSRERTAARFTPPSREDILLFCNENRLIVDADRFLNYYQSNGWKVGKNPMKDWKATVRNWAREDKRKPVEYVPSKKTTAQQYTQRDYIGTQEEAMENMLAMMKGEGEV